MSLRNWIWKNLSPHTICRYLLIEFVYFPHYRVLIEAGERIIKKRPRTKISFLSSSKIWENIHWKKNPVKKRESLSPYWFHIFWRDTFFSSRGKYRTKKGQPTALISLRRMKKVKSITISESNASFFLWNSVFLIFFYQISSRLDHENLQSERNGGLLSLWEEEEMHRNIHIFLNLWGIK